MKVLQIASLLPVPGLIHQNDYVLLLCEHIKVLQPNIQFQFYRPSSFLPFINKNKWKYRNKVRKLKFYSINGIKINILSYLAIASNEFLFTVSSVIFSWYYVLFHPKLFKKIDLVHAHYLFPDGMLAYRLKKKYGIPYIVTVQNEQRLLNNKFAFKFCNRIIGNAKSIVCVNPEMKNQIIRKSKYNVPIKVLGLGIDKNFYNYTINIKEKGTFNIVTIAQLYGLKNLENQIKAIKLVSEKYKVLYTIIGDGEDRDSLNTLCKKLQLEKIVKFIPFIENSKLPMILSKQDLFLLASYKESWGKVYIEAMSVGLPVILTKNTGVYQYFIDSEALVSVVPNDINDIAKTVVSLIENIHLRKSMSIKAKEVAMGFEWSNIANQYLDIIG